MPFTPISRLRGRVLLAVVLAVYFAVVVYSSHQLSPCEDESAHVRSGMTLETRGAYVDVQRAWWTRLDLVHPIADIAPALAARLSGQSPDYRPSWVTPFNHILAARWTNHLTGALILVLVFLWAERLWGTAGGLISALFLASFPLFLAHASIVSSDLYMLLGALVAAWSIWELFLADPTTNSIPLRRPSSSGLASGLISGIIAGLAVSFAMCCKLNNVVFLPVAIVAASCSARRELHLCGTAAPGCAANEQTSLLTPPNPHAWLRRAATCSTSAVLTCLLLTAAIYEATHRATDPIVLRGHTLPHFFGDSLLLSLNVARKLYIIQPAVYFMGRLRPPQPWFYAVSFLTKTPPPLLLISVAGFWLTIRQAQLRRDARLAVYLVGLFVSLGGIFATRGIFMGLRHMLPLIALLALLAGSLGRTLEIIQGRTKVVVATATALCLALGAATALYATPWQLSYYNVFAQGKMIAVDSESDWGQGLIALRQWQQRSAPGVPIWLSYFGDNDPADFGVVYRGLPAAYTHENEDPSTAGKRNPADFKGWVAISKTELAGSFMPAVGRDPDYYAPWRNVKPTAEVGGSILIFDRR